MTQLPYRIYPANSKEGNHVPETCGRGHWLAVIAPLGYSETMQTVVETPTFMRQADKLFSEDEKRELIDYLAKNPLAGDNIPCTGGVRRTGMTDVSTRA